MRLVLRLLLLAPAAGSLLGTLGRALWPPTPTLHVAPHGDDRAAGTARRPVLRD